MTVGAAEEVMRRTLKIVGFVTIGLLVLGGVGAPMAIGIRPIKRSSEALGLITTGRRTIWTGLLFPER